MSSGLLESSDSIFWHGLSDMINKDLLDGDNFTPSNLGSGDYHPSPYVLPFDDMDPVIPIPEAPVIPSESSQGREFPVSEASSCLVKEIPAHPYAVRLPPGLNEERALQQIEERLFQHKTPVEVTAEYVDTIIKNYKRFSRNLEFIIMHNGKISLMALCPVMIKYPSGELRATEMETLRHYKRDVFLHCDEFIGYFFCGRTYVFHNSGPKILALHVPLTPHELVQDQRHFIFQIMRDLAMSGEFLAHEWIHSKEIIEGSLFLGASKYEVWQYNGLLYVMPISPTFTFDEYMLREPLAFRLKEDFVGEVLVKRDLPSIGSIGHFHDNCTPCQFECYGKTPCKNGFQCGLCHCRHTSKKKQRANEWRENRKETQRHQIDKQMLKEQRCQHSHGARGKNRVVSLENACRLQEIIAAIRKVMAENSSKPSAENLRHAVTALNDSNDQALINLLKRAVDIHSADADQ